MAVAHTGQASLVHSLAALLRNHGDQVLSGGSTLTLQACTLAQLTVLFERYLLSRPGPPHGFLALASHPADTRSLLELQFLFDVLQKTISLKLVEVPGSRAQSAVKIFPFKSLKSLEVKRIPPHRLEGLRAVYSQLEVFTCSRSLASLEELLSLCGGDLSSALPWLDLHTLNFSYNSITCLDASLSLLNVLRSLDLSHNKIQDCAEFLKPLSELEYLNLGYNSLQRAPSLPPSARAKLHTLILRNNELETINGVEQLASLQHVDLAYNLLLEHSQLAPLALLHNLHTLSLEGNPLFFQRSHRPSTVRHLSPRAARLKLKLDGAALTSSELSVLPKPGQFIGQSQAPPPVALETERGAEEGSSGAGELSDSMSVGEVAVTRVRRKKARAKVKVRRASISEPSDTDHQPRLPTSSQDIVLPHQKDIERMDSFREQLGEDWLRYQHHLEGAPPSTFTPTPLPVSTNGLDLPSNQARPRAPEAPEVPGVPKDLPPPAPHPQPRVEAGDGEAEQEAEEPTLQWCCQSPGETQSTLENEDVPGPPRKSGNTREEEDEEEEEEDLGVDLCHPLLVGVLPSDDDDEEEEEVEEVEETSSSSSSSSSSRRRRRRRRRQGKEVFLRVKQTLVVEVEVQRGTELCRLDLDSLARVELTQHSWSREGKVESLPGLVLHFRYGSRERRRSYVLLDDDPHHALQMLSDMLCGVAELNRQRDVSVATCPPGGARRRQCLRCGSEFTRQGASGEDPRESRRAEEGKENSTMCPECGSDHVVDLAIQSAPSSSTPIKCTGGQGSPALVSTSLNSFSGDLLSRDAILSSSPIPGSSGPRTLDTSAVSTTASQDPTSLFVTAQESCMLAEEDQADSWAESSLSHSLETHGKEELAGSYCYASTGVSVAAHGDDQSGVDHPDWSSPNGEFSALSEDNDSVDHRLQLFLDMEVFEEEEEELQSFLKMSTVRFGQSGECPSLLVVSNQRFYFLEITSHAHNGQLSDWLQKRDSHPITELSYLEVGLGSQTIHMAFEEGALAYTLLVRDDTRCKSFFSRLTGVVRELAPKSCSKLKSISTARLDPQHHLWSLVCEDDTDAENGHLDFFYLLAFLFQDNSWTPLTVLVTKETLYLLNEDHQWCKSPPSTTANESRESSSGAATVLESQPISCVSSARLWPSDACRMDIQLYDETVKEERTWSLRAETPQLTAQLLTCVRTRWEAMFGVALATTLHDANAGAT